MTFVAVLIYVVLIALAVISWIYLRTNEDPPVPEDNAVLEMETSVVQPERPDSTASTTSDLSASCYYTESKRSSSSHRDWDVPFRKEERVWGLRKERNQTPQWTFCKLLQGSDPECFAESDSYLVHFFSSGVPDMWLVRESLLHNTQENRAGIVKLNYDLKLQRMETIRKLSSFGLIKIKRSPKVGKVTAQSSKPEAITPPEQRSPESKKKDENVAVMTDDTMMLQTKESTSLLLPGGDPEILSNCTSPASYSAADLGLFA